MTARFPHLKNNESDFPYLEGVDVYKYDNSFDYSRYDYAQMKITVCKVPWDMGEAHVGNRTISGIGNVVFFDSKSARDKWFDDIPDSECFRYVTKYRQLHRENLLSVDIPFDVASDFNYVAVEYMGIANDDSPVLNEKPWGRRHWFWFIREVEFSSPNTTILHLLNDAWQTFIYDIDVSSMILERGHAPLVAMNATNYLKNPLANSDLLLTEDVDFGGDSIVRDATYLPIGNGRKYVLFAIPMTQAALLATGATSGTGTSSAATFANTAERWGYQLEVDNYQWGYAGDYSNGVLNISALASTDNVFNGNMVFAVASESASSFFDALAADYVHVLNAIQGVFVVDSDSVTLGTGFTFHDYTVYPVSKKYREYDLTLTKNMFGYPANYAELAKLYTYPYAYLEFTDDEGFTADIRIENTSNSLKMHKELSIAFPFVQYRAFVTGANGNTVQSYTWRNLANSASETMTLWEDDFSKLMATFDIPTYALHVSSADVAKANEYADSQARRQSAITAYQNAVRSANTSYENAADSQDTANTNVYASADTMISNQSTQNQANTDITTKNCNASTAITNENKSANSDITGYNNTKMSGDTAADNAMTQILTASSNAALAATTAANNGCSTALTNLGVMQNVAGALGSAASADIGGAVNAGVSAYTAVQGNQIQVANANCVTSIQLGCGFTGSFVTQTNNNAKYVLAKKNNDDTCARTNLAAANNTATSNDAMTANTRTGNTAARRITGKTAQNAKDNSDSLDRKSVV